MQRSEARSLILKSLSVRLSVRRTRGNAYMVQDMEINFTLFDWRMFIFGGKLRKCRASPRTSAL